MSILGDFFGAFADGVTGSSPQEAAPVPQVSGGPPRPVAPVTWTAPDASGTGQVTVHRDVLDSVSHGMRSDVAELDAAVRAMGAASDGLSSLSGWQTGSAFGGNVVHACRGFATAGTQTGDTQSSAAKTLADSASTYDEAETASRQAVNGVRSQLDAAGGSVYSAGGI
jgi:hypothetical protein